MKITRKDNYSILKYDTDDIPGFATYLTKHHADFEDNNVIVDVLNHGNLEAKELLMFLEISNLHRANKKSFVIASNPVAVEKLPEDIIIAPTLREAEDIINMEELERELGF